MQVKSGSHKDHGSGVVAGQRCWLRCLRGSATCCRQFGVASRRLAFRIDRRKRKGFQLGTQQTSRPEPEETRGLQCSPPPSHRPAPAVRGSPCGHPRPGARRAPGRSLQVVRLLDKIPTKAQPPPAAIDGRPHSAINTRSGATAGVYTHGAVDSPRRIQH
jgi:hypothetical protein